MWENDDLVFSRGWRQSTDGNRRAVLAVRLNEERPHPAVLDRFAHEYGLRDELDSAWALRPLELVTDDGQPTLMLEDPGGEPLSHLLGEPMEVGSFLLHAVRITAALGKVHQRGIVHKDIKPHNILMNRETSEVKLTGFGIASRLPRERQAPEPPETIAGTLAYMAPEQTGRMNRSIDSRSDLYALGATFYQMLTGQLPFSASDPMDWVHCHIARRAIAPAERLNDVPGAVSKIVMKLLAKTAEDRYQTAPGLERDLQRCLTAWAAQRRIEEFPLAAHDVPDRLVIPEKLYGREREIETLLTAFDRIVKSGAPELVLVSGYSGIGKSSVVNELHKALVPPRGLFAAGKFDQLKRDIPYSTLAQAFQSLVRPLLSKSDAELVRWREALLAALGLHAQLMVDLVPELSLIIGDQPPVPELPPQDAQRRFQRVFRRFIGVFARPEHPLALFLDDLQWLDAATIELLEDLLTGSDLAHLMLIGAYRDNEVDAGHPLRLKLDGIRTAGGKVEEITLAPLAREHLARLIADALRCELTPAAPLARLAHEKTGGNPFFAIQFISALADERMLSFDYDAARWSWDIERIHAQGYTDNVVNLMVGKLARLPTETQKALQLLACFGNSAEIATASIIFGTTEEQVHAALWPSARQELVERLPDAYRFVHDRIQEAAYSLIPEKQRGEVHLRIGRLLVANILPEKQEEAIFDIVNQLNRGAALITSQDERDQLAEFNLLAAKRAKASTAYASALTYLVAGAALLPECSWEHRRELMFELELNRAECEHLTGDLPTAEQRLTALSARVKTVMDLAAVAAAQMTLCTTMGRLDIGVSVCLEFLARRNIHWSPHPTDEEVKDEYDAFWQRLGTRSIEELIDLPRMADPEWRATSDVLIWALSPAFFTDQNLHRLMVSRIANLSLEHGNSDASPFAYVWVGAYAGFVFDDYRSGFQLGKLGFDLVERRELTSFKTQVYFGFANFILPWSRPFHEVVDLHRRAFAIGQEVGDLTYAVYAWKSVISGQLPAGVPLATVQREAERALAFVSKSKFVLMIDVVTIHVQLVRALRGMTTGLSSFSDAELDEQSLRTRMEDDLGGRAIALCFYLIRKLQAQVLSRDFAAALATAEKAQVLLWTSPAHLEVAEFHFYAALARAGRCDEVSDAEREPHLALLRVHHDRLAVWAENCHENFDDRESLIGAEIARIEGREVDAMRLFERAIRSAAANGLVHNEALANELASHFYAARGFEKIAHTYLRDARYCYLRWGADGKVRQLDEMYPHVREADPEPAPTGAIGTKVENLDLATVIKVSQAISGEIVLEKLLDTIMRTAMAQAGAERAALILALGAEPRIAAEATTGGDSVTVHLRDEAVTATTLSESVLRYAMRTRENIILDDAVAHPLFAVDPYIRQRQARSILCLPLLNRAELIGVLYLENNLVPRVFSPARISVLKLLASQATISLENTRLYRDLAEREAKIRRLVEANIIGIFVSDIEGRMIEANDAFLHMMGYDREDFTSGSLNRTDLTPPEWRERDEQTVAEVKTTGTAQPFEKEYYRKDGSRVPVLIGVTAFDEKRDEGVGFVLDLTERKRAEADARDSERRYREVQTELAHANRVATMGQLTASIAHEVKQPIAASVTNVSAALRWLDRQPPDMKEVREALARAVSSGNRAGEVLDRIRNLVKKAPPRKDSLAINEAILEVIELTRGEVMKNSVSVQMQLAEALPSITGDQVQLQQVVLNLIINAVQAMSTANDEPRQLLISTEKAESGGVLVAVRDSGPGLAPGTFEHVFDAFHTTKASGLGMGLSICRSIVEAHGGRLWASQNLPRGAAFQFTLPACVVNKT
ncbi:AAA family ATPase [Bradyrhizobium sp. Pear77]|nr:AAA family ATPase [Bradyrhizobium altum]